MYSFTRSRMGPKLARMLIQREQRREHDQQQADAVHAELVLDAEGGHPGGRFHEAEAARVGRGGVEAGQQEQREAEAHQRGRQGQPADEHDAVARHEGDEQRARRAG